MKTILVPTDLSPMTTYALDVAVGLARTHQAEIVLLHTVLYQLVAQPAGDYTPEFSAIMAENYEMAYQQAQQDLQALASNPRYAGVVIKTKLGSNLDGLIRCINEQPADLIVLASQGASGLMEWLEGSNAERIVRHAHCPVLVVKGPIEHFQPKNIVCGIDLDEKLKERHMYPFQLTDQGLQQFVYVLTPHDVHEPEGIRQWMDELALAKGIAHYQLSIWRAPAVAEGILDFADQQQADLIVLYTHGRTGLSHWIQGSVAEDVLNHAKVPVLVMRA
ncbi:nucleotide-binding universal stress UspA family protein [Larkinella arboricola]|uniref:Nucleotide-binding universal stress UspA family protein n=1 Tax=Larkinella arboricola TaxID=643671 RepID=A0A327WFC6_LARAB|nr:universal stress protein [Larkinella arboricola]RAJ89674.1 nucleotide-binding universal stress UspA family protein [Larkinella arboricola]